MSKAKLDLSCFPDNFRDDYEEIVHDIIRLKAKWRQFNGDINYWLAKQIVAEGPAGSDHGDAHRVAVTHRMLVLIAALSELQVPIVFDEQLKAEGTPR